MKYGYKLLLTLGAVLISPQVLAHSNSVSTGLLAGLSHPLTGIDHLAALILAGTFIGRNVSARPLLQSGFLVAFLCVLGLGAGAGIVFGAQAWIESAILLSIPVFLALQWAKQVNIAAIIISLFMIVHGWAHGVEMSAMDNRFIFGFLLSSMVVMSFSSLIGASLSSKLNESVTGHA